MNNISRAEGFGANDLSQRLIRERIVFLGTEVDQDSANRICAELLLLEAEDPDKDISLYINSPGGIVFSGLAIYDTMQYVNCDIRTSASALRPPWVSSCSVRELRASDSRYRTAVS
jgi:ATP-dependent Clp protease protease subunit